MALPLGLSRVSVTWFQNWPVYGPISKAKPYFGPTFTIFEADGLKWWKWPVLRKTGRLFKVGVLWAYVDVHGPEEIEIRLEMDGIKVLKRFRLSNRFNMTASSVASIVQLNPYGPSTFTNDLILWTRASKRSFVFENQGMCTKSGV